MFKGILPGKRVPSSEFEILTGTSDNTPNGKENALLPPQPMRPTNRVVSGVKAMKLKGGKEREQPTEAAVMNQAFDKLLDELQIPTTLRPKLATMDSTVKAAMLKSSQTIALQRPASPPVSPPSLRRTRSSGSMDSPSLQKRGMSSQTAGRAGGQIFAPKPRQASTHARGGSYSLSRSQTPSAGMEPPPSPTKSARDKSTLKKVTPAAMAALLEGSSSTQLEIESAKKLRLLLRNEPASWTQEFLREGGYSNLIMRLNEILEVEWREEQHDDQILHELLRCFKALSTSSIGCFALRSSAPTPFVQLVALLYSDKKPGDVATRQVMVDLLLLLFDVYPPSSLPAPASRPRREAWEGDDALAARSGLITLPAPHKTVFALMRALLLTPAPPPTESPANPVSPHAFIENLHRPRIYKTYLQELSDVCRDYFWVFCHPNNTIWSLDDTDEAKVEKPRAPGGMTGGVEFEAMGYMTTHFKLVNAIGKAAEDLNLPKDNESSAHQFHTDLFLSGFERILLIARKASTTYYPTLHLEISRYMAFAARAGFEVPWTVSRLVGLPPTALCKPMSERRGRTMPTEAPGTPGKKRFAGSAAAAALPQPRKVTPLMFD